MKKVLLVYDDFNELTLTESFMKKVGLDVVGISNEVLLNDQILSFNPDVVVAFGQNQRVSSFSVGQRLKQSRTFAGKSVLVTQKGIRPKPEDMIKMRMDALVEAPLSIERLLQVLSKVLGIDGTVLQEKLQRAIGYEETQREISRSRSGNQAGSANPGSTANPRSAVNKEPQADFSRPDEDSPLVSDPERMAKYAEFLQGSKTIDTRQTTFQREDVRHRQQELKKEWDFNELDELDRLKREFAGALFKKK